MHIIKLNAIGSTNSFLKELVSNGMAKNYTVVTAESQYAGKGQMGASWVSESGKNLIFSMFVELDRWLVIDAPYLNFAISLSIYEVLKKYNLPKLSIKWPNDILSDKNKLCGILVENTIKSTFLKSSIIGIGINVNQTNFPKNIGNVSSVGKILEIEIDRELLLKEILEKLKTTLENCTSSNYKDLKNSYLEVLYNFLKPTMFESENGTVFMGKIVGVNSDGNLEIEMKDETIKIFGLKEIKMIR